MFLFFRKFCFFVVFFFFQAEDGIRDIGVTGVQTCALPISGCSTAATQAEPVTAQELIRPATSGGVVSDLPEKEDEMSDPTTDEPGPEAGAGRVREAESGPEAENGPDTSPESETSSES